MSRHISIQTHQFTRDSAGNAGGALRPMPAPAEATNVEKVYEAVHAFTPETFELVTAISYELPDVRLVREGEDEILPGEIFTLDEQGRRKRVIPKIPSPQLEVKIDNTPIRLNTVQTAATHGDVVLYTRWSTIPTLQDLTLVGSPT